MLHDWYTVNSGPFSRESGVDHCVFYSYFDPKIIESLVTRLNSKALLSIQ